MKQIIQNLEDKPMVGTNVAHIREMLQVLQDEDHMVIVTFLKKQLPMCLI